MVRKRRKIIIVLCLLLAVSISILGMSYAAYSVRQSDGRAQGPQQAVQHQEPVLEPPKPVELPWGGRRVLPGFRYVGLYGTPSMPVLGALGRQDQAATIERVKALATEYQPHSTEKIIPTLEIIVTVASSGPTSNGDYSQEIEIDKFQPLVAAAKEAGVYIVLDLQPGRVDFLSQAKLYEEILKEPHVGLALDPEWRIGPTQVHLKQIGSVSAAEVNATAAWLADLVKTNDLPQKVFLLHQFKLSMLPDRAAIDTTRPELAYVIQMDGQGPQHTKLDTWRTLLQSPPADMYFGWKNFYEKDPVVRTPAETMTIEPKPWFVSYQ